MKSSSTLLPSFASVLAAFVLCGCQPPPGTGDPEKKTSVTWCNFYNKACTEWGLAEYEAEANDDMRVTMKEGDQEVERDVKKGQRFKGTYRYCKTPGVTSLCDEKEGCEVCFDPAAVAGLNRSEICNRGCREFNAGQLGHGSWGAHGSCFFHSVPNTGTVHAPPVQANMCVNGHLTKSTQTLILDDGSESPFSPASWGRTMALDPRPGWGHADLSAAIRFTGDVHRRLKITDGRVTVVPESCWDTGAGTECFYVVNEFVLKVEGFSASGHTLREVELTSLRPFRIRGKSGEYFSMLSDATMVARFKENGTPRVATLRAGKPFSGVLNWEQGTFWIAGESKTTLKNAGPFGTDVELSFLVNSTSFAADVDVDGLLDHLDNCPAIFNPDQADTHWGGGGDACDVAPRRRRTPASSQEEIQ
jgi:hypothetical protein